MKKVIAIMMFALVFWGCSGKKDDPTPVTPSPAAAVLDIPAQNSVCTTGTIVNATQSTVSFTWKAAANTDSYDLIITNLLTGTSTTQNFAVTQASVTLLRNTPYSWYVTSKANATAVTTRSDTWKFYNSGPGTVTYAPFPAAITSPTFGQAITGTSVNLTWTGSSVTTTTTLTYDVYFGNTVTPALLKSGLTDMFLNNVSIVAGNTYYWKIITKDTQGNSSDSGIYQFKAN